MHSSPLTYLRIVFCCRGPSSQFAIIPITECPHNHAIKRQHQCVIETTWHLRMVTKSALHIYVESFLSPMKTNDALFLTWPTWYPSRAATLSGSILLDVDLWPRRPDSPLPKVKSFPSAVTTAECRKPQASWEEQTHMTDAINTHWCAYSHVASDRVDQVDHLEETKPCLTYWGQLYTAKKNDSSKNILHTANWLA